MSKIQKEIIVELDKWMEDPSDIYLRKILLFIWKKLNKNKYLGKQELLRLQESEDYQKAKQQWSDFFFNGQENYLKTRNQNYKYTLAIFQSLDEYLSISQPIEFSKSFIPINYKNKTYFLYQRKKIKNSRYDGSAGSISRWLKKHWIFAEKQVKGEKIKLSRVRLPKLLSKEKVKCYIVSFKDGVIPHWEMKFSTSKLTDENKRWLTIECILEHAKSDHAEIIVLPELMVSPTLREKVADWLAINDHPFSLILPGSYHETLKNKKGKQKNYNITHLLDEFGIVISQHKKFTRFKKKDTDEQELTTLGNTIELLVTPIGTIVTPICLDYCDDRVTVWEKLGVDWLLVPAYSEIISPFIAASRKLDRHFLPVSIIANQPYSPESKESYIRGYINDRQVYEHGYEYIGDVGSAHIMVKSITI